MWIACSGRKIKSEQSQYLLLIVLAVIYSDILKTGTWSPFIMQGEPLPAAAESDETASRHGVAAQVPAALHLTETSKQPRGLSNHRIIV